MPRSNPFQDLGRLLTQRVVSETSHADYICEDVAEIFEEEPVDLCVFLYDKKFLRMPPLSDLQYDFIRNGSQVYFPSTLKSLGWKQIPYYRSLVAKWGKGSGKDTVARLVLARLAYLLMILKDPQKYMNVVPGDKINMLNVAYSAKQAQEIFFEPLKTMLGSSLWFRDRIDPTEDRIRFPHQINICSGHSEQESMEGQNLLASVLDEIAAFKTEAELAYRQRRSVRALEHSAEAIDQMITSSATSRFPYQHKVMFISFTRFQGDYIEQKYEEALATPLQFLPDLGGYVGAYASWGATWEVNPTKTRPMFDEEYRKNPENARARYECRPPKATDAYFKALTPALIERVFNCVYHKDATETHRAGSYTPNGEYPVTDDNIKPTLKPWSMGEPGINHYGHVDIGLSNNRAGICITRRSGFRTREIPRTRDDGYEYVEKVRLPLITVVLWFSFLAPPGGEVDLENIRRFLFDLHEKRNCRLKKVTFDKFQSADNIQMLNKRNIEAELLSVDRDTEPYDTLKDFIYGERLNAYYREIGVSELERLNIVTGSKIDHPLSGSKDEADALAGAVYNASVSEVSDATLEDIGALAPYSEVFGAYATKNPTGLWEEGKQQGVKYEF